MKIAEYGRKKRRLLEISNNMAERAMRSHALGRKNFLFCQNEDSANRTCKIYTVIESCKLCGVDPYKYLCEILSREPEVGESWSGYASIQHQIRLIKSGNPGLFFVGNSPKIRALAIN